MTIRSVFTWSYSLPSLAVFFQIFHLRRLPLLRIANYSCYSLAHILTILSHIAHSCNYSTCVRLRLSISKRWLVCLSTHRGGNTIGKACRVSVATRWRALSHVLRLERAHDLRMGVGVCTRRAGVCVIYLRVPCAFNAAAVAVFTSLSVCQPIPSRKPLSVFASSVSSASST